MKGSPFGGLATFLACPDCLPDARPVGYNRAARIIEHMEREGMVGPQEGTRSREVFLPQYDTGE